ncbi:hypothetical protein ACFVZM_06485 [Streptomyces sioyaensis]|uniref:hypothetical protein n=1 Tax=Streptomyces sioyaensis TaxID=67364 RepID=UPI00368F2607
MANRPSTTEFTKAIRNVTQGWSTDDPRWDALQVVSDYFSLTPPEAFAPASNTAEESH